MLSYQHICYLDQPAASTSDSQTAQKPTSQKKKNSHEHKASSVNKSASLRISAPEKFYFCFKNSYFPRVNTAVNESDKNDKYTYDDNIESLKMLITENKGLGQKQMINYCIIGGKIKCLKEKHKMKDADFDKLLESFGKMYSKNMRNFYVRLHKFALKFNRIMFVDISAVGGVGTLYNKWSSLKSMIENEADFWKGT